MEIPMEIPMDLPFIYHPHVFEEPALILCSSWSQTQGDSGAEHPPATGAGSKCRRVVIGEIPTTSDEGFLVISQMINKLWVLFFFVK